MKNTNDLTVGNIQKKLYLFTLPIIATSFINITYSFVDMICIGRLGSGAVASIGTAAFFLWFVNASASMARIGTQVLVSREYGKKDYNMASSYFNSAFFTNLFIGLIVAILLIIFKTPVIVFFNLGDEIIIRDAKNYLFIIALSIPFMYVNHIISAMFNSIGNSKTPFLINSTGLLFNIVFDILLIFGIGIFPRLEVIGAGIATALAQVVVFILLFYNNMKLDKSLRLKAVLPDISKVYSLCKIGFPSALQSTLYCMYSIVLARIIANFGPIEIAVQKVGSQIETISWMSADGLATAITAFVGQNFGVKNFDRIKEGIKTISSYCFILGFIATVSLIFFGSDIYRIFINEQDSIISGASYLRIIGYSQLFMCFEILFIGVFSGYGQTRLPALISIIFTGLRIPIAMILSETSLGIDGVWLAISLTSIAKGIIIPSTFFIYQRKFASDF